MKKTNKGLVPSYQNASGKMRYTLTNDYLFRALLQKNNKVLKGLSCSLKHLKMEDVRSVTIENPILLGEALDDKTFVLDVKVLLNNSSVINYEMQVINLLNWAERSLIYLCRVFDQLHKGEDYLKIKPATLISFLDFTLFPEQPEFYATYQMMNVETHHLYTDKFALSVIDLKQIGLATEEDKEWQIDCWASLFKATTWEEVKMLAEKNEMIREAAETLYQLTQEEKIREQCIAREEYYRNMNTMEKQRALLEARIEMMKEEENRIREARDKVVEERDKITEERDKITEERDKITKERDKALSEIEKKDAEIARLRRELEKKGN